VTGFPVREQHHGKMLWRPLLALCSHFQFSLHLLRTTQA
jgi:hypothetical protein